MASGDDTPLDGSAPSFPSVSSGSAGSGPGEPNPFTRPPGQEAGIGARRSILGGQDMHAGPTGAPDFPTSGSTLLEPRPAHWSGTSDRVAPPFAAPGTSTGPIETSLFERLVEGAYRWRTLLGLGLAGVMTVAIVVAYNATTDERLDVAGGRSPSPSGSAVAGVTPDGPLTASSLVPSSGQQIGSSVDEAAPSTSSSIGRGSTTTAGTVPATTASPSGPTTVSSTTSAPGSTESTQQSSTTATTSPATSAASTTAPASTTTTAQSTTTPTTASTTSSTSTVAPRVRLEAEDGALLGQALVLSENTGFSGSGYVGDITTQGSGVQFNLDSTNGGTTALRIRYAAGREGAPTGNRYLTLRVNGVVRYSVELVETADWSTWSDLLGQIELQPGRNTVSLLMGPDDNGFVNLDYIELN